jgi:hypothetical protein
MNSPLPQHPLGSLADILQCNCYVRFTSTADIVATQTDVCFVPKAEIHSRSVAPTLPIGLRSSGRIRERKFSELALLN